MAGKTIVLLCRESKAKSLSNGQALCFFNVFLSPESLPHLCKKVATAVASLLHLCKMVATAVASFPHLCKTVATMVASLLRTAGRLPEE
jgi:hypothetical protein